MKRILAFTLIFAMLFTAMLGIMPAAEGEAAKLEITHANLEFASNVYLLVAVDYTGVCADEAEALEKVYITVGGDKVIADADLTADEETPDGCVAFKYTKISAKEIGDIYEIAAFVDGEAEAQDTTTYSILEYAIKTKVEKPGTKLANAVAAMINFGAAAQDAFGYKGDYALADENGVIDYGMVVFGGAAENKKAIAKVGTTVNVPAADTSVFAKYPATLYGMSFNAVTDTTIQVAEGVSRYFYYGEDLEDKVFVHTGSYGGRTHKNNVTGLNLANLDLDTYTGARTEWDFVRNGNTRSFSSIYSTYSNPASEMVLKDTTQSPEYREYNLYLDGAINTDVPFATQDSNAQIANAAYLWSFRALTAIGTAWNNAKEVDNNAAQDDRVTIDKGYLYLNPGTNEDYGSEFMAIYNRLSGAPANFLTDGKMTISISVALDPNRGEDFASACYFAQTYAHTSAKPNLKFFDIASDGTLSVGGKAVTTVNEYNSTAPAFTTVHFVIDENSGTVTAYTENGGIISADYVTNAGFGSSTKISDLTHLTWMFKGSVYVNRITLSEGSLFD
ncbi:MAG: hypothetical protein IKC34_04500 [Clostridia bacterium]|nr:hypothetical protein [Clostridia bacterium]